MIEHKNQNKYRYHQNSYNDVNNRCSKEIGVGVTT